MKKSALFVFLSFTLLLSLFSPQKTQGQEATGSGRHDSPLNFIQEEANYYANPEFAQKSLPAELQSKEGYQSLFGGLPVLDGLLPRADFYQEVALPQSFAPDTGATEPPKTGLGGLLQWLSARIADVATFITGVNQKSVKEAGFINFIRPEEEEFSGFPTGGQLAEFKGATQDLKNSLVPSGVVLSDTFSGNRPLPSGPLAKGLPAPKSRELENMIKDAAIAFGLPLPVLATVAWTESWHQARGMWEFTDEEIRRYSEPGAISPLNPNPNGCRAAGPLQFLIGGIAVDCGVYTDRGMPDVWGDFKNAVNEATGENRTTDYRNIKDTIYAAAKKLKQGSGTSKNDTIWSEGAVRQSIQSWYGSCLADSITEARFGPDKSFCDFVWEIVLASRKESL